MEEQGVIKILEGKHIYLRPIEMDDLDDYYAYLSDPTTSRFTGTQKVFSRQTAANWIENISKPDSSRVDLMIVSQATDRLVGEVVLNDIDPVNRSANIRIAIAGQANQGKGYGTEAMLLMLHHAFGTLNLHRVELSVYAFNDRAIHVYEKLGFKREGVQRDYLYWNHQYHDAIIMSILEHEFRKLHMPDRFNDGV
ncbi:aminoglycoside N(6')-acetyltransferase [Paenibacillus tyrfis]|uniref:GNAT family N-acetyltransferase n=1 Tax=Paenibacillus tyrfis TaxID=1501230 RepID=UPI0024934581|nr:GNAT family protein [Paenibacillus tyrfis]GLI05476.1 aminoglycoside N(6')-acetyltransferase [Paenibacillus tyrfis]